MTISETKIQRDQALACLILAVSITLAAFLAAFGEKDRSEIERAREEVASQERLLRVSAEVFQQNQDALNGVVTAIENLDKGNKH